MLISTASRASALLPFLATLSAARSPVKLSRTRNTCANPPSPIFLNSENLSSASTAASPSSAAFTQNWQADAQSAQSNSQTRTLSPVGDELDILSMARTAQSTSAKPTPHLSSFSQVQTQPDATGTLMRHRFARRLVSCGTTTTSLRSSSCMSTNSSSSTKKPMLVATSAGRSSPGTMPSIAPSPKCASANVTNCESSAAALLAR
mmetsp:Transcript_110664/g.253486  ORF Transcript_110664/g.253486 Transcript_110664/m.253486 type:complete len:205 (-) Transcript_110664:99-713(-)